MAQAFGAPCSPARPHTRHISRGFALSSAPTAAVLKPYARRQALFPAPITIHLSVTCPIHVVYRQPADELAVAPAGDFKPDLGLRRRAAALGRERRGQHGDAQAFRILDLGLIWA